MILAFLASNWVWISPIVLETGLRLFPTKKNVSIVSIAVKVIDMIVPNLKVDEGGVTKH